MIKDSDQLGSKQRRISKETKGTKGVLAFDHSLCKYTETFSARNLSQNGTQAACKLKRMFCFCFGSLLCTTNTNKCGKATWVDVPPLASISDTGPIEFEIEGKQQELLGFADTLLYVTVRLSEIRWIRNRWWQ